MEHIAEKIISSDKEIAIQYLIQRLEEYLEKGEDPSNLIADNLKLYLEYYG